jgi:hypothetical protein
MVTVAQGMGKWRVAVKKLMKTSGSIQFGEFLDFLSDD